MPWSGQACRNTNVHRGHADRKGKTPTFAHQKLPFAHTGTIPPIEYQRPGNQPVVSRIL